MLAAVILEGNNMDPQKQSNWVQMVTGAAVLIGFGLVI
jgi:hypothetical protein